MMSSIDIYFAIAFLCGLVVAAGKRIAIYFLATDLHRVSSVSMLSIY
jgi:hypothetical protein